MPWLKPKRMVRSGGMVRGEVVEPGVEEAGRTAAAEARAWASGVPSSQGIGNH